MPRAFAAMGALACLAMLGACAGVPEYRPAVDMTGHTQAQYDFDLEVCREDAAQIDILRGAAIGAIAGTAIGAGAGTFLGDTGVGAVTGLAGGALAGGAAGSLYGKAETARSGSDPDAPFIRSCMAQRGYVLLDPAAPDRETGQRAEDNAASR
ncbi:MAG TPA: hypothetical protein VKY65_18705 [Alphaproteobacteria bacterium]|nr:hypothetical protein [Alphaproteobacteria bacterium]